MCWWFLLSCRSGVDNIWCLVLLNSKERICIERSADVFAFAPTEVHSLPASSVTEGRLSLSAIRPTRRNLIYYPRLCFGLNSASEIGSCLMDCVRDVDSLDGFNFFKRFAHVWLKSKKTMGIYVSAIKRSECASRMWAQQQPRIY